MAVAAGARAHDGLLYACITHVPLPLPFPPFVTPLYTDGAQGEGRLNLRDLAPEWERHHPLLGGAAATYAVKALLQRTPGVRRVGLCQYRKFVSRERVSQTVARSFQTMDVVAKDALPPERFARVMEPGPEPFLLSRLFPMKHQGYLGQYSDVHRAQDLLFFTAEAVELGVLGPREARSFLNETVLITGGLEMGVYPADFWLEQVSALEAVMRRCIERHPLPPAGYQARAWAFCAERFGSYLLLRHFRGPGKRRAWRERLQSLQPSHWSRRYVGRLNLITDTGHADYVAGST